MESGVNGGIPVDVVRNSAAKDGNVQRYLKDYATTQCPHFLHMVGPNALVAMV